MSEPVTAEIPKISAAEMLERYELMFFDAYGVLVDGQGPLPGAAALTEHMTAQGHRWYLLTNDASRSPATIGARCRGFGLTVADAQVVSSSSLVGDAARRLGLVGKPCVAVGTDEGRGLVAATGVEVRPPSAMADCDGLVIMGFVGDDLLRQLDAVLSGLVKRARAGRETTVVLANPDLIYPTGEDFGFTSGSFALLLREALARIDGGLPLRVEELGKPAAPIFEAALAKARADGFEAGRVAMIGDQVATDIVGARNAGIDAILIDAGLSRAGVVSGAAQPHFRLTSLVMESGR